MEIARAAARHGADLRASGASILGLIVRGQDLELGNRVEHDRKHLAVIARVHRRHAVELEIVGAGAQTVGADIGDVTRCARAGSGDDARRDGG